MGVAIAVPEPFGGLLRERRASFGDRLAATVPSHVTLLAPTDVDDDQLGGVCAALADVAASRPAFSMRLRGTGTFRPVSPVVFVAVSQGISSTEVLARAVRERLEAPEPGFPFHPHVTVAHNVDDAALDRAYDELAGFECEFTVDSFAMYLHDEREGWRPQHTFALARP